MKFFSRKWIRPYDLNAHGSLFGGQLLQWIDEEAAIFAMCQLNNNSHIVTKYISEIDFKASAKINEIIEMGMEVIGMGRTSVTLKAEVRNKVTKQTIITVEKLIFVAVDADGKPTAHGCTMKDREGA
ncbi:MAG: acyl-CoA thioesterase [Puniceicoccales bacterium]